LKRRRNRQILLRSPRDIRLDWNFEWVAISQWMSLSHGLCTKIRIFHRQCPLSGTFGIKLF
jgi:hypothetical protein